MVVYIEPLGRFSALVLEFHEEKRPTYGHSCIQRSRALIHIMAGRLGSLETPCTWRLGSAGLRTPCNSIRSALQGRLGQNHLLTSAMIR